MRSKQSFYHFRQPITIPPSPIGPNLTAFTAKMPPTTSTLLTSTSKFTELIDDDKHQSFYTTSPESDLHLDDLLRASIAETLSRGRSSGNVSTLSGAGASPNGSPNSSRQNSGDRDEKTEKQNLGKDETVCTEPKPAGKRRSWMWSAVGKK